MIKFDELEIDALQELMNIAFGQAASELSEVIDIKVHLSFPKLNIVNIEDLPDFINGNSCNYKSYGIVEQPYKGKISGVSFLLFPKGTEKDFLHIFHGDAFDNNLDILSETEKEVLSEVGNILISACVSKLFDILDSSVTYMPPVTALDKAFSKEFIKGKFEDNDFSISLETSFSLGDKNIKGFLFLINHESSAAPIKEALSKIFKEYI
jgi:chemotaxis protein CheC